MRILLEILLIAFLAFVGWRQPFRDLVRTRFPQAQIMPSRLAIRTLEAEYYSKDNDSQGRSYNQSSRLSNGDWMYDGSGTLDAKPKSRTRQ